MTYKTWPERRRFLSFSLLPKDKVQIIIDFAKDFIDISDQIAESMKKTGEAIKEFDRAYREFKEVYNGH